MYNYNNVSYILIKQTCLNIGLNQNQVRAQVKNIQNDLVINKGFKIITKKCIGKYTQSRSISILEIKYLPIWLSKINPKPLNEEQYKNIIDILNWSLSSEFDNFKTSTKIYSFESELRDEIYNEGHFNNIKITGKEIVYNFGRVDLEGRDVEDNKYIIELKRYKDYKDVIEQCKKYKKGFKRLGQDIHIIICQYDCSDIKEEALKSGFECYEYKRQLILDNVG